MKRPAFEELVEKRANERVQSRIRALRKDVYIAVYKFLDNGSCIRNGGEMKWPASHVAVLMQLAKDNNGKGWPSSLWEEERKAVTQELFGVMDEMQRMLLAKPVSDDNKNTPAQLQQAMEDER